MNLPLYQAAATLSVTAVFLPLIVAFTLRVLRLLFR